MFDGEVPQALGHTHVGEVGPGHADDGFPAAFDEAILGLTAGRSTADRHPVLEKETVDRTPQEFHIEVTL